MGELLFDLRLAARRLWRFRAFTVAGALALALGLGSSTAIFAVIEGVLLRPLPYPRSEQLLALWEDQPGLPNCSVSGPELTDWKEQARSLRLSGFTGGGYNLTGRERAERLLGAATDSDFFAVLQQPAALGRTYGPGSSREVVLSDATFRGVFGGDAGVVGRSITLSGEVYQVVGVLPRGAGHPAWAELWVASEGPVPVFPGHPEWRTERGTHYLRAVARLQAGATLERARAELEVIGDRIGLAHPEQKGHVPRLSSLRDDVVGPIGPQLYLLLAGVGLLLVIACANVAGLQLAQAASRQRELATRLALGATRLQLVRQLLSETALLGLAGGALGMVLARWGVDGLVALLAGRLPRAAEVHLDGGALAFAALASLAAGLASGLGPALLASRPVTAEALKQGSPAGFGRASLRSGLVVAEVALALVLLATAGLLVRSFLALRASGVGFEPEGAVALRVRTPEAQALVHEEVARRVAALPGVTAAGAIHNLPLGGDNVNGDISIAGRQPPPGERWFTEKQAVSGDYFRAMGIPLLRGRTLGPQDSAKAPQVALINRAMAERFWPGTDALGQRFSNSTDGPGEQGWIEVVGIVGDVRQQAPGAPPLPEAYFPVAQDPQLDMTLVVRGPGDLGALASAVRREVAAIDSALPVFGVTPLTEQVAGALAVRSASTLLLGVFAALALLLSVLGVYATMAYAVVQRTREIGVRMALGSQRGGVVRLVVRQGMQLALLGVALGVPAALVAGRVLASQLYGVGAGDALTHGGVSAALLLAALLACWLPARVAARVSPMVALRAE